MDESTSTANLFSVSSSIPINVVSSAVGLQIDSSPIHVGSLSSHHVEINQRLSPVHTDSLQSGEHMEVVEIRERQATPQNVEERVTHTPQQDTHTIMVENRENDNKIVVPVLISDSSGSMNKDSPSPMMAGSPSPLQKSQENSTEMRSIVLINENGVPVSKDCFMPPSPNHASQPPTSQQLSTDGDNRVRGILVYSDREASDPITQFVKGGRDDSMLMKESSYPITCGNSKGDLYWKKFVCPGINAKCVKCRNVWMTPKEFVQEAGKSTLKDWKRAIRINGTMLRKMIESGDVDYYQHDANCSNQCRSNKGAGLEASMSRESFNNSFEQADPKDHVMSEGASLERSSSEENAMLLSTKRGLLSAVQRSLESQKSKFSFGAMSSLERSSSEDSGLAPSPQIDGMVMRESIATADKVQDLQGFWSGIVRTDLFDDVVQDVITQVTTIKLRAKASPIVTPEDAIMMTNIANALELIPAIAQKMATHKITVERQAEQSNHVIQELERKLAEQRRFEVDLKRKSQHLETVMSLTPNEKRKRKVMSRLYRQKAVDTRIPPSTMHQPGPNSLSSSTRIPSAGDMVGVVPTSSLIRYSAPDMWVPQQGNTALTHALQQVASNPMAQISVSSRMMGVPIPPHLLSQTHDHTNYQLHQDSSKK